MFFLKYGGSYGCVDSLVHWLMTWLIEEWLFEGVYSEWYQFVTKTLGDVVSLNEF